MDNLKEGSAQGFEDTSTRFMRIFSKEEQQVQPVGVKLILNGQAVPEGTRSPEECQGVPWCEAVRLAAMDGEVVVINRENVGCPAGKLRIVPDLVILGLLPKQVLLAIQGYNFRTGNRFLMSTVGIRGVCADLTAQPYLEQKLNGSFFCLGARAVGGWDGNLMGLGMPFSVFRAMVAGMERSACGFPYQAYPD